MRFDYLHGFHSTLHSSYGGRFDSRPGNDELTMTDVNLESVLKELRCIGEVEHTFRVVQIGRAMLRRPPPSLANLQLVMRDFYFNYRRFGSPAMSAEHLLTVNSRGLLFTSRDPCAEIEKVNSTRFGPEAIVQVSAVRFVTKKEKKIMTPSDKLKAVNKTNDTAAQHQLQQEPLSNVPQPKKPKLIRAQQALLAAMLSLTGRHRHSTTICGRFCTIDKHKITASVAKTTPSSSSNEAKLGDGAVPQVATSSVNEQQAASALLEQGPQTPWFLIQSEYEFLSQIYHPPLVIFTLRRQHRIRSIDLHVFVCCSDSDAVQLVTFVTALCEKNARARDMPPLVELNENNSNLSANNKENDNRKNSPIDDESYYERLIVKEATAISNNSGATTTVTKTNTLTRKSAEVKLPFVNPNVTLSPFGTLNMAAGRKQRALAHPNKLAAAVHFSGATHSATSVVGVNNKPTIFEVVLEPGGTKINPVGFLTTVDGEDQKEAINNKNTTVNNNNNNNNNNNHHHHQHWSRRPSPNENAENYAASDISSGGGSMRFSRGGSGNSARVALPPVTGELLPLTETADERPIAFKNASEKDNNIYSNEILPDGSEDLCWSQSELTAVTCSEGGKKTAMILGDVQTLLGYLP